jgi:HK97 gp10 family phage protein
MADELTVTVNVKPLQRLGELLAVEVEKALETLSAETVKDAQSRAPVRTGFLRDSISGTVTGPALVISVTAPYAGFVELGTRRMPARPFATPAVDQAKSKLPELLQEAFRQALAKARP